MPQPQGPKDPLQPPPPGIPAVKPKHPTDKPLPPAKEPEPTDEEVIEYQKKHGV